MKRTLVHRYSFHSDTQNHLEHILSFFFRTESSCLHLALCFSEMQRKVPVPSFPGAYHSGSFQPSLPPWSGSESWVVLSVNVSPLRHPLLLPGSEPLLRALCQATVQAPLLCVCLPASVAMSRPLLLDGLAPPHTAVLTGPLPVCLQAHYLDLGPDGLKHAWSKP